ncbi:MAG TPA: hydroxyacylglutathione hydrolase [Moraxellaceae bacterium]|nr:hydroxyacylglutathione hydrolase [Moraxellaceae bacterium]
MSHELIALPAFSDNYIWALCSGDHALVVDPGDPAVVDHWISQNRLQLDVILITHHHTDHTGGLLPLLNRHKAQVFGPDENIQGLTHVLSGGETLKVGAFGSVTVLPVPGHTLGHIAYYLPEQELLFAGDTLFSAGCGRLFEGTAAQMYASLQSLAALPDSTRLCCAHEYTASNLRFAASVEPGNPAVTRRQHEVEALRAAGKPSLPVTLGLERGYNPFLRCHIPAVAQAASLQGNTPTDTTESTFAALRAWKDRF